MTVLTSTSRSDYDGNGSTTVFSYPFKIFAAADLVVTLTDANGIEDPQILNVDYTVSGAGSSTGGNVTMTVAPPTDYTLSIERSLPATQEVDLRNHGPYLAEVVERALDRLTMLVQQALGVVGAALRLPVGEAPSSLTTTLPPLEQRKGHTLGFDPTTGQPGAYAMGDTTVSAAMIPVVQAASIDAARTALGPFDEEDLSFGAVVATILDGRFQYDRYATGVNATIPVHAISAVGGAENDTDVAILRKRYGALLGDIPDGGANGGNKRGTHAIDLQLSRESADQVASGQAAVILAGFNNRASQPNSFVITGYQCSADASFASAQGDRAENNRDYSHAFGAFGGPSYAGGCGCQSEDLHLKATTTDATATTLVGVSYNRSVLMADQQVVMILAQVVGYQAGATPNAAGYVVEATVKKGTGAGTTTIVGSPVVRAQENNAAWDVTVTVTDGGGTDSGVNINVVGAAGVTIHWVARVHVIKMRRNA